ncbi:glycosyltransferase family 4 protein [Neobacillus cucumis]|uniref:glycosyltransferase family 4 protein n=1 Tax=Neobacillus cucumis TaxID=1740721 RepID=UPI0018DFBFAA|nr:glycosyltransferase family 4 protein [Neobacillus cucumis]MBI0577791.1 glycosyltransferase family 4 protein [Neobacillus cucumis]
MIQFIERLRSLEFLERAKRLQNASPQQVERVEQKKSKPLHIVYVLGHVSICGGVKVIFQHANGLTQMGFNVSLVSHFPKPDWYPIEAEYITVPFEVELTRAIPICDVIVATYWDHIHACIETGVAPVVYFEQGDFHLFDPIDHNTKLMPNIKRQFQLPTQIITISHPVKEIIKNRFDRDAHVFSNALDTNIFYPKVIDNPKKYMMIVGSDTSKFKGIDDLLEAFDLVQKKGHDIELLWLTPAAPETSAGEVFVNPPQSQIGELYRKAFVYVCGSYYEAFSLPCLEAMACGTPVVTTRTPGVREYAEDEENCLMVNPGDVQGLADRIIRLLTDEKTYQHLQSAGLKTAKKYSWDYILNDIAQFYEQVAEYRTIPKYKLDDWLLFLEDKTFEGPDAVERLQRFLSQTEANEVYGPVEYLTIPNFSCFIWQPLAKRKNYLPEGYNEKILLKAKGDMIPDWPGKEMALCFQTGDFIGAITKAREQLTFQESGSWNQGVSLRWVIQCLIELKQFESAQRILTKSLPSHPFYTDLYFLQAELANLTGAKQQATDCLNIVQFLQDAAFYPEYLNIKELLKNEGGEL